MSSSFAVGDMILLLAFMFPCRVTKIYTSLLQSTLKDSLLFLSGHFHWKNQHLPPGSCIFVQTTISSFKLLIFLSVSQYNIYINTFLLFSLEKVSLNSLFMNGIKVYMPDRFLWHTNNLSHGIEDLDNYFISFSADLISKTNYKYDFSYWQMFL